MDTETSSKNPEQRQVITQGHSASYTLFMLGLNIYSLIVMVGLMTPLLGRVSSEVLWRADFLVCIVFLIDFSVNLWRAPSKGDYFFRKGGWLNLLGSIASMPGYFWTSLLRLARLNQLGQIVKHLKGQDRDEVFKETLQTPAKTALLTMIITALVLITIASLLVLWVEKDAADAGILTGADAFW